MKKQILLLILFILPVILCHAQQPDCKQFHSGKFKIVDVPHRTEIIVARNDTMEMRTIYKIDSVTQKPMYQMQVIFAINWINDCSYTAKLLHTILNTHKGERMLPTEQRSLTVNILKTKDKDYLEEGVFNKKGYANYKYIVHKLD